MNHYALLKRVALLTLSAGLSIACSTVQSSTSSGSSQSVTANSAASPAQTPTTIPVPPQNAPLSEEDKMPRIKGDEAKRLFEKGDAIIVDVRSPDQYKMSHAKVAINVPLVELENGNFGSLPKNKRIIAYCT